MKYNRVDFNVEVNDVITPSSCSAMIIEFIKYVIYQKELIPYPYERLKMCVDEKKKQLDNTNTKFQENKSFIDNTENSKFVLISDRYYKKTKDAYDSLENIFKVISEELTHITYDRVEEVVLVLGTSFLNPEDVFRLCIPSLSYTHCIKHHPTIKNCRSLYREMFKSEQFHHLITTTNCTSSLRVMLKMKAETFKHSKFLIPRAGFNLPAKGNHTVINFGSKNPPADCSCTGFEVFEDLANPVASSKSKNAFATEDSSFKSHCIWYQLKNTLRHFSDVYFNGTAMTDHWMNPILLTKEQTL